jgi:hypothetical protein
MDSASEHPECSGMQATVDLRESANFPVQLHA